MVSWLPIILPATAIFYALVAQSLGVRRKAKARAIAQALGPMFLVHSINDERCTGCETCVHACPTNVLALVGHKSRAVAFEQCVQCERCARVCPTNALVMHRLDEAPPSISVPDVDENFQTRVPGQYLIGEVAGKPLVKNAANLGRLAVEHIAAGGLMPRTQVGGNDIDVVIVGSGPGGLSAALACLHHGLSCVVLEKDQTIASTVARYPGGKEFMAEPADCRNVSFLPVYDATKEQLLATWHELIERCEVPLRLGEAVESVDKADDGMFDIKTTVAAYRARRVVLATGVRGKPRTLGVPGENLPKVLSMLERAADYASRKVLVVGGGDSALEAACALAEAGARVTMSYRRDSFGRAKPANARGVAEHAAAGRITIHFSSAVAAITAARVELTLKDGTTERLDNDACFVLIGADRPVKWLARVGVAFVERPHTFELGRSDALVQEICGPQHECPRDAAAAFSVVTGRVASARIPLAMVTPRPAPKRRTGTMGSLWSGLKRMATDRFHRPSLDDLDQVVVVASDPLSARREVHDDVYETTDLTDFADLDGFEDGPTMVQSSPFFDGPTSVSVPPRW